MTAVAVASVAASAAALRCPVGCQGLVASWWAVVRAACHVLGALSIRRCCMRVVVAVLAGARRGVEGAHEAVAIDVVPPRRVDVLLERGASVNVTNAWGWQALHFAAAKGSGSIAWRLLQAGADVEQKTNGSSYQASPLQIAQHYNHNEAARRLQ